MNGFARMSILSAALLALWTGGCVPGAFVVGQNTLGVLVEDRPLLRKIEDAKIHANLLKEYFRVDSGLPVDVNTNVWEGRVLLTGVVDAERKREAVLRIAGSDPRIRAVYNHIVIGSPDEVERSRAANTRPAVERDIVKISRIASDAWIEAKLNTQFLATDGVHAANYRWQSVRNKVYIIGRARTEMEKKLIVQIIRSTKGVIHVQEHIQVKPAAASGV